MSSDIIRILQIVPNMQAGGLENFIMNLYRNIDKDKIQFDFLVHYTEEKHFDKEIESLGGKIYRFSLREDNNIFKYIKELNKFYKQHPEYKVIHCHMSSIGFINFLLAKKNGVKVRIAHSHNSSTDKTIKGRIKRIMMIPYKYVSTTNYACSTEAGKYLYGNKHFEFIPNSIECKKFEYDPQKREKLRKKYGISENDRVIGHIGRFNIQKNHKFIIEIFKEICNRKENLKLILIGNGELLPEIENLIETYGLKNKIIFTGVVNNVNDYYNLMDMFLLPSLFEGLPVVGVEAQANGLPCLIADSVTKELQVTNLIEYLPIKDKDLWIDKILKIDDTEIENRKKYFDICQNSIFNIHTLAIKMEKEYLSYYERKKK